jgi:hypothetical protein
MTLFKEETDKTSKKLRVELEPFHKTAVAFFAAAARLEAKAKEKREREEPEVYQAWMKEALEHFNTKYYIPNQMEEKHLTSAGIDEVFEFMRIEGTHYENLIASRDSGKISRP